MSGSIAAGRHYVHAWWILKGDKRGQVSTAGLKSYVDSHSPQGCNKIDVESTSANPRGSNPLVTETYRTTPLGLLNPMSWVSDYGTDTKIDCHLWFEVPRETDKSVLNDMLCDAFRSAAGSAGAGWSITQLRDAMNLRSDTTMEDSTNMPGVNPEVRCSKSSFSPVRGDHGGSPSTSSLGNILGSTTVTAASDNTVVGTSPGLRNVAEDAANEVNRALGFAIPWWGYAVGGIVALAALGYAVRSFKLAVG